MGCEFKRNNVAEEIPENIFACPDCGVIDPEISKINVDNKKIEFYCKKCAEKEYESKDFAHEKKRDNSINYYLRPNGKNKENQFWFKEYNKKNVNSSTLKSLLKKIFQNKLENAKETINKKNEQLNNLIKFNRLVQNTCQKYQNNYFHLKSLKNIHQKLQKEILRDSNDLRLLLTAFNNEIEFSDKAIAFFEENTKIKIERQEESLFFSKKQLNDINIMTLSMIKFNQLKEIDLSENEITNIEPISNMNLPFLEFLNLSFNKINNIKPLGELNSKKLKYLFIQNNQIENLEDIKFLCDCDFPNLKILRLENNNIQENEEILKGIIDESLKKKRIIVTNSKIDEIKKKYKIEYNEESKKLELEGVEEEEENEDVDKKKKEDEEGELLLKNLFIVISQKNENKIKELKITNCKIKNPSILNRIHFDLLETLDLSLNNITNLKFLKGMRAKSLKNLFLNDNCISDLSLLYNLKDKILFPDLELISLDKNKFNPEDEDKKELKKYLKHYHIEIQLEVKINKK